MPANFTRRLDLFKDAGFPDPPGAVRALSGLAELLPFQGAASEEALIAQVARERKKRPLIPELERLAARVPEWLFGRGGDLATVLWLAQEQYGAALDLPAFALAVVDSLFAQGRARDGFCLIRFLVDVELDFGQIHREKGPAYGFFQEREPNPFVWKLLEHYGSRPGDPLRVAELGCGIGNDALGLLSSPRVDAFVGIDIGADALARLAERTETQAARVRTIAGDFVSVLRHPKEHGLEQTNLIYSYSSLHYFNSAELGEILALAHALLLPNKGALAFAIKGAGSLWEGQGVPLYRPDVWINWDGQSRWFPSVAAVDALVERHGFAPRFHELHEHWGYSERGRRDLFHYVLCTAV